MNNLEKMIIDKCISFYSSVCKDVATWGWSEMVPEEYIICESLYRNFNNNTNSLDKLKKQWRFINGEVRPYSIELELQYFPRHPFYSYVVCAFFISEDEKNVYVDYNFGPRFGRGFQYDIEKEGSTLCLKNEKQLWVS